MTIAFNDLKQIFETKFPDSIIKLEDLRGDENHYSVEITSSVFQNKSRIEQHRIVQDSVKEYDIHALAIKTNKG